MAGLQFEVVEGEEPMTLARMERWYIFHVVAHSGGKIMQAARVLGIHRNTLARKMRLYNLKSAPRHHQMPDPSPQTTSPA